MSVWIADRERSRAIDHSATADHGVPVRTLMENAGSAVFEAAAEMLREGGRLAVLCGKGNNGGDGFACARLAHEHGYSVQCLVAAKPGELRGQADEQRNLAHRAGVPCAFLGSKEYEDGLGGLDGFELIVDALLGIGVQGEVQGPVLAAIQAINASDTLVVAVDVPSGIDCDTGAELGDAVWALRTVTFGLPKPCLFQAEGLEKCGFWSLADIGFPEALLAEPTDARLVDAAWVGEQFPERLRGSHKGHNGAVLIVAGSVEMPGAAVLVARAALRSGAGYVGVAGIPSVLEVVARHVPEAVLRVLPEVGGAIGDQAAAMLLAEQERWDAMIVGPGLSMRGTIPSFLAELLPNWRRPACIDADALNAVAGGCALPPGPCVLTPHPGELGRLLGTSAADVQRERFGTARHAALHFGQTVLLKGAHSLVAETGEPLWVNRTGNAGMAVAGMGDVLSGVVGTLLAQGLEPGPAAACAMYWHGLAGDLCAQDIGPQGYTAMEVADNLARVRATIVSACDTD